MRRVALVAAALALDAILGDPFGWPHPVRTFGDAIATGERFIRARYVATPRRDAIAGALLTIAVAGGTYVAAALTIAAVRKIDRRAGVVLEVILAATTLAIRDLLGHARDVHEALASESLEVARMRVGRIVGRDTADLDSTEIARATIESLAESFCDGIVAPLAYLAIGGAPAALAFKAVNTLDSMIGHRDARYAYFGRVAARLDDVANWIPARVAALVLVAVAALRGRAGVAFAVWQRDASGHASPNAGQSEAVMAGALGVRLGGTNRYDGETHLAPQLGAEHRSPAIADIERAMRTIFAGSIVAGTAAIALARARE